MFFYFLLIVFTYWVVGKEPSNPNSYDGWISSSSPILPLPTDETDWLYSRTMQQNPNETDPTLKLVQLFDQEVTRFLSDIKSSSSLEENHYLVDKFVRMEQKDKQIILLQINSTTADILTDKIPSFQLDKELLFENILLTDNFLKIHSFPTFSWFSKISI